jgi:Skp family chaperone for outer membrane proteins
MNFPLSMKGLTGMRGLALAAALSFVLSAAPTFAQQAAPAPRPTAPAAGAPTPAAAPPAPAPFPEGAKYAFVNIQRIANESIEGKAATAKVNALVNKKQAEGADRTKQLQAAQQRLETGGSVMNEATRAQLQKDIDRLTVDIQRFNEDAQQEVQVLQNDLMGDFQIKLAPVIDAVAKEKKLHMVFSTADAGLVWGDPGLDLTSEVIAKFDAATPAPAASAPAAAPAAPAPQATPAATAVAPLETAPPPLDNPIPEFDKTGFPDCDDYVETYRQCLNSRLGSDERRAKASELKASVRAILGNIGRGVDPVRVAKQCKKSRALAAKKLEALGCTL